MKFPTLLTATMQIKNIYKKLWPISFARPVQIPALNSFAARTPASTDHRRTLYTSKAPEQSNIIIII